MEAWQQVLGDSNILWPGTQLHELLQNTTAYTAPEVVGLLIPENESQLRQILEIANTHRTPVYPYSKGLNWGLGSKLPPAPGCALVDLSRLNRILEINTQFHYAIVEPGVTQKDLADALESRNLPLMLNVTGSAPQTSVLANMLERGSGFLEHRINDLRGIEVMLADGSMIRSGFWHLEESKREIHHFPFGLGADWRGLFSQSNLGVVTKAVVNLYPKKEMQKMIWCKLHQNQVGAFVEKIADLYQRGYIHSATHIGNNKRMKIEHQNQEAETIWTAMAMVQGSARYIGFLEEEIPAHLAAHCDSMGFLTGQEAEAQGIGPVFGCHTGKPTDYFVRAMYQSEGALLDRDDLQIDLGRYGMLCCLPILPAKAEDVEGAIQILDSIDRDFGIIPAATLNPLNDLYLESVINIYFDRTDPAAIKLAHEANAEMHRRFYADGYRFYRFDVETKKQYIQANNTHFAFVSRLKEALDPSRILSPGRYEA